jgi:hypothetical protein
MLVTFDRPSCASCGIGQCGDDAIAVSLGIPHTPEDDTTPPDHPGPEAWYHKHPGVDNLDHHQGGGGGRGGGGGGGEVNGAQTYMYIYMNIDIHICIDSMFSIMVFYIYIYIHIYNINASTYPSARPMPSASSSKGQLYPDSLSTPTACTHTKSAPKAQ